MTVRPSVHNRLNLSGKRIGKLSVKEDVGRDKNYNTQWLCLCDCGNTSIVRGSSLNRGLTNSCGCGIADRPRRACKKPKAICSVPECREVHHSKQFCSIHYSRWKRHGDPLKTIYAPVGEPERFLRETVLPYTGEDCLTWPYGKAHGYGRINYLGEPIGVHRLVCSLVHGDPPSPIHQAAHSCGRGHLACVSPNHLSWKTQAGNSADAIRHGVTNRGRKNPGAKLSETAIAAIRAARGTRTQAELSKEFGVDPSTISYIHSKRIWGWLET
jgi:hypothetical protein